MAKKKKKNKKNKGGRGGGDDKDPFSLDFQEMLDKSAQRRADELEELRRHSRTMEKAAVDPWQRMSSELQFKTQCLQRYEEIKDKPWVTNEIILQMFPGEMGKLFVKQRREHASDGDNLYT